MPLNAFLFDQACYVCYSLISILFACLFFSYISFKPDLQPLAKGFLIHFICNLLLTQSCRFIGKNKIGTLEGLHDLHHLKELHIEHQLLPQGEKLLIDPRSMETLSVCIRLFYISDQISSFLSVHPLVFRVSIQALFFSFNFWMLLYSNFNFTELLTDLCYFILTIVLFAYQANLRHLNIAGNNLDDLSDFTNMRLIKSVDVSHNKLMDIFVSLFKSWINHASYVHILLSLLKLTNICICDFVMIVQLV